MEGTMATAKKARMSQTKVDGKKLAANDKSETNTEIAVSKKGLVARAAGLQLYIAAGRP